MRTTFQPDQTNAHRMLIQVELGRATANFKNKQKIYRQGEDAGFVYFVQEGSVKLVVLDQRTAWKACSELRSRGSSSAKRACTR